MSPVDIRAGPFHAVLDGAMLRNVRYGRHDAIQAIYVAVRDRNWGTVPPRVLDCSVEWHDDSVVAHVAVDHTHAEAAFRWRGRIEVSAAGWLTFTMDGSARSDFRRNRIGICVLHAMELAGTPVDLETSAGPQTSSFPVRISPHQVFRDVVSMGYTVGPETTALLTFTGDIFETEDQRNWSDASFKTYSTPLSRPFPQLVRRGEQIHQSVRLNVRSAAAPALPVPAGSVDRVADVSVGGEAAGVLPDIGLVAPRSPDLRATSERATRLLATLGLSHLRVEVDATAERWGRDLAAGGDTAVRLGLPVELAVCANTESELVAAIEHVAADKMALSRLLVFEKGTWVTPWRLANAAQIALRRTGLQVSLGGGSAAWFAQLNRNRPPLPLLDSVAFALSPQVHAEDELTIRENLGALRHVVGQARAIAGGRSLAVGPVTLKPRFQPTATGPPVRSRPGDIPQGVDHRQPTLFAAGWLVGCLGELAVMDVSSLTFVETTGWRGVVLPDGNAFDHPQFPARPGATFPIFHVLAAACDMRGGVALPVHSSAPGALVGFACRKDRKVVITIANLTNECRTTRLRVAQPGTYQVRRLDDARAAPHRESSISVAPTATLELGPYVLAFLECASAG